MKTAKRIPRGRRWLGPSVVLVGVLLLVAGLYWYFRPAPPEIVGAGIVSPPYEAPNFTLTDQFGHSQSLRNFRGRPIALTFIYTNCPDVCPLIAANMHAAYQRLGDDAPRTVLAAVTVDPRRDNIQQIRRFSEQHALTNEWFFFTGTSSELQQVWRSYGIEAQPVDASGKPVTPVAGADTPTSPEVIEHSAPVFLIDKQLKVRALLPVDFTAATLVTDLKVLLAEQ